MTHSPEHTPAGAERAHETLRAYAALDPHTAPERIRAHERYEEVRREWLAAEDETGTSVEQYLHDLPEALSEESRLVALWLHHPGTCFHALRTARLEQYVLAHAPNLAAAIAYEGVSHEDNVRAALLHDDGKRAIPEGVLAAHPNDAECLVLLEQLYNAQDQETRAILARAGLADASWDTLRERARAENPRPVRLLPIRALVDDNTLALLLERGFEVHERTLLDIISEHERFTREYLAERPLIAAIAGHHHTPEESPYPISAETLGRNSHLAQELLHVLDIVEAVSARRDYHAETPLVVALQRELDAEARRGQISAFVLYHVAHTLMETPEAAREQTGGGPPCIEACAAVQAYLTAHTRDAYLLAPAA